MYLHTFLWLIFRYVNVNNPSHKELCKISRLSEILCPPSILEQFFTAVEHKLEHISLSLKT